jgi:glycosyltransferase involved in cell wall biosynthesis
VREPGPQPPHALALGAECRDSFARLSASLGDPRRLHIYSETQQLADFYRPLIGLEVGAMPAPGLLMPARGPRHRAGDRPPTVLCIGFANRPKGYGLLPEAIEQVLGHRDVRFLIHGIVKGSDAEDDQPIFDRLATLDDRVTVRQDVLSDRDYATLLGEADLLLLPYDPAVYRTRGSGVFTDARKIGLPVVATGTAAFAGPAFEQGWGVAIAEHSASGVAAAVLTALERLDDLTSRAAAIAERGPDELGPLLQKIVAEIQSEKAHGLAGTVRRLLGRETAPRRRPGLLGL